MGRWKRVARFAVAALFALAGGCQISFGGLSDRDSRDAKLEEARIAMDEGDYAAAAAILEALGVRYPADPEVARSMASAYSGRAGLDYLSLAAKAKQAVDNAPGGAFPLLAGALPRPVTAAQIADIAASVGMWRALASASGSPGDSFSLALAQVAQGLLIVVRNTDLSPVDGVPDTVASMPDADAVFVYDAFDNAIANLGTGKANLDPSSDILAAVVGVRDDILARPEPSLAEKVRRFLKSEFDIP